MLLIKTGEIEFYELDQKTWKLVQKESKRFNNPKYAQRVMVRRLGRGINPYYASKSVTDIYLDTVTFTKEDKESLRAYYA